MQRLDRLDTERLDEAQQEIRFPVVPSRTVADLASPGLQGTLVFVTDEAGGAVLAFSDGTNWRRVTDRAVVS